MLKKRLFGLAICSCLSVVMVELLVAQRRTPDLDPLIELLAEIDDAEVQADILRGMLEELRGVRTLPLPDQWPKAAAKLTRSPNVEVRQMCTTLSLIFGDPQALKMLRNTLANSRARLPDRISAIENLAQIRDAESVPLFLSLLEDDDLNSAALKGLVAFRNTEIPETILAKYDQFDPQTRRDATLALASRPEWGRKLLHAVEENDIAASEISAFVARQLASFDNPEINEMLMRSWGNVRPTKKEIAARLRRYKRSMQNIDLNAEDLSHGRTVFRKTCASCHKLFGEGKLIGPDLTGSQRHNLDYVLMNVLDPSASVGHDFQMWTVATSDGRVVTGIIKEETSTVLTLQTANEVVRIPIDAIEQRKKSEKSMMPEGLLEKLSDKEVRRLIGYLGSPDQVPLPPKVEAN